MDSKEWSSNKKWNPFNSDKLLAQIYRWKHIKRGNKIPQPALITIDPINVCNLHCTYCNASNILSKNNKKISTKTLLNIADFLAEWQGNPSWEKGVCSVCIAGGGSPLLHNGVGDFINRCVSNGIEVGVVTNGTMMHKFLDELSKCVWVGVSVDAGCPGTFKKIKKTDLFDKVIENIVSLVDYSKKNNGKLSEKGQGNGISYKFLLHPDNVYDIKDAIKLAKKIGCKNFHCRPCGRSWDSKEKNLGFTFEMIDAFNQQIQDSRELEDENFGVFGITHKFDSSLKKSNCFEKCYAIFMTAVFSPSFTDNNKFNFSLCCDRRGDDRMILGKDIENIEDIKSLWGSEKHWSIFDKIDVTSCPRCTYSVHCTIYENCIITDNMTYNFI